MAAILLLGGVLRFYGLTAQSIWSDELASWYFSNTDGVMQVFQEVRKDIHPPGYFLLLHFTQQVIGDSAWALRFPSALAGWLSIAAMYFLGRRIYSGREGLIAALFVAVLWAPIYYSQETRSYSLLILFTILTTYFWWGIMMSLRERRALPVAGAVGYVLCSVACAYLHYFGLLLVALQGAILLGLAYRSFGKVLLLYVPVVLAYVPWLPGLYYQVTYSRQLGSWISEPTPAAFVDFFEFLFNNSVLLSLIAWTLLAFLLPQAWNALRERRGRGRERERERGREGSILTGLLLVGWLVVPIVLIFILSKLSLHLLTSKNLLISLPAAYLLVARSITRTFSGATPGAGAVYQSVVSVVVGAVFLAHLLFSMQYYTGPHKEQIREAVGYIASNEQPATLILYCDVDPRLDYYFQKKGLEGTSRMNACEADKFPEIENRVRQEDISRVFYLLTRKQPDQELFSLLQSNFDVVADQPFSGTQVATLQVRAPAPTAATSEP